jgi:hypothetical protein
VALIGFPSAGRGVIRSLATGTYDPLLLCNTLKVGFSYSIWLLAHHSLTPTGGPKTAAYRFTTLTCLSQVLHSSKIPNS